MESIYSSHPTVAEEDTDIKRNIPQKPQIRNFYNILFSFLLRFCKLPKRLSRKKDDSLCDVESIDFDPYEAGQTIENKTFKHLSYADIAVPLSYDSIKRSILKEMKKCGRLSLLYDIAKGKISRHCLKLEIAEATITEINIALLWSAFCRKLELMEELVSNGANIRYSEATHGLAALHVAAFTGCAKGTEFLVQQNGSGINVINKWYSPLHCAALAKRVETARILLDNGARLNSMTNGPGYQTPLYFAVRVNAIDCVKLFVDRDAQIYQEGKMGDMSPLFLAAELGHSECLKIILETKTVKCNELKKTDNGNTALHIAAEEGHSECIEILLDSGANSNLTNLRSQSALHLAVKANSYTSVITLIRKGDADPNLEDYNKRTPLHEAVELLADSRKDIVKALITNGANVNAQDQHGFTPLHIAALNELSRCVSILISNGADYSIKSKSGISAFSLIAKKTPSAFDAIRDKLTEYITLAYHSEALNEVEMRFDFKNGLHHPNEYSILNAFIDAGHKEMLLHPYIMAFLYVTWGRIRRCYYGMIYNSVIFSLLLLCYVLTSLAYDCDRKMYDLTLSNSTVYCTNRSYLNELLKNSPLTLEIQWYILLYFTLALASRKIYGFHGYPSLRHYCTNWGNVLEWHGIIYVFIISFLYTGRVESWQMHAAAFAVICSSTNIMILIGQLPAFGPYVEMFQKVQNEFQKLLLVFFPFLVGYSMVFCIIFPNSSAFYNPLIGFISVLVMMTGDMNYNILLDYAKEESSSNLARFSAQLMYTFFLLFITIILMNLLVGIAVHDIQGLQKNADLSRLMRQTKMCSYIEISHYKRSAFAKSIMTLLRVIPKAYLPVLKVKPLEPEETPILKEIIQGAYDLAKKRELEKKQVFSRSQSEGSPRTRLLSGSLKQGHASDLRWTATLSQLVHKLDNQNHQIKKLHQEITELKEIVKSGCPLTPVKKEASLHMVDKTVRHKHHQ